jgi:hypothetical protein
VIIQEKSDTLEALTLMFVKYTKFKNFTKCHVIGKNVLQPPSATEAG